MNERLERICITHIHCQACRNKEGGRQWRDSLRVAFKLPNDETDFECPHGLPWGCGPQTESQKEHKAKLDSENAEIERISKICEACCEESDKPKWDEAHPDFSPRDDCEFLKCSTCARRRAIREGEAVCRLGKFSIPRK
jgi:hypothetical protein